MGTPSFGQKAARTQRYLADTLRDHLLNPSAHIKRGFALLLAPGLRDLSGLLQRPKARNPSRCLSPLDLDGNAV